MDATQILTLGWSAWLTLAVIATIFLLLILTRLPADFVFLGGLSVLLLAGVLDADTALQGFASKGLVTVGVLYVIVMGLQETGGLSWISRHVLGLPKGWRRAQLRLMTPVIALSAFLNNTPVVALFIPVVTEWCRRIRVAPSRLMIPLSYAAIFGGICTLIGTSTNLVVNGMLEARHPGAGLGMFEIAKVGVPCALAGIAYLLLASHKLLPDRKTLDEVFAGTREYTLELQVSSNSPLIGKTIEASALRHLPGAFLAELIRDDRILSAVPPDEILREDDRLVFVGNIDSVRSLCNQAGLEPAPGQLFKLDAPRHQRCLVEAVVSDTCPLLGKTIREGHFRNVYNAVVIAVARNGERLVGKVGDVRLSVGDTLLVESHAGFIPRQRDSRDFYLVSALDASTPRRFEKAPWAFAILVGLVVTVSMGWFDMLQAAMLSAILMLLTGCCSPAQARRGIEWNVLLVIAAALGIGQALECSGAARVLADLQLGLAGDNPWAALAMIYVATNLCTEIISNNAAAALMFPIAMNAADRLGVSHMPFVMAIMIAASASFSTPIGYQTNLMVYGPGGYRFGDYVRIGLPLNLLFAAITLIIAPLLWPFR